MGFSPESASIPLLLSNGFLPLNLEKAKQGAQKGKFSKFYGSLDFKGVELTHTSSRLTLLALINLIQFI